jgi:hypothetical protein
MINLIEKIFVRVAGSSDYGINPDNWYRVIGTEKKDGKEKTHSQGSQYMSKINLFVIVNDSGQYHTVYPSKCVIVLESKKPLSFPVTTPKTEEQAEE